MKKLKTYEAPTTRVAKVALKTSMLAASIMESAESKVETKGHEVGETYNFEGNASSSVNNNNFSVSWE